MSAADGWAAFSDTELGFALAYPERGEVGSDPAASQVTITFAPDPGMNVVEEIVIIRGVRGVPECRSPLAEGWAPGDLSPETVALNGVTFLRQTHSGVAAGTSSTWIAYTTQRDERCVSLSYVLRTFDPANLDPTAFPTPPGTVDIAERIRAFEAIVSTFAWLD